MAAHEDTYDRRNRGLWIGLALPGTVWLLVLFVVPFYVMLAVAGGGINEFFQTVVPVWNVYGYIPYVILVLYAFLDRIDQSMLEAARDLGLNKWRTFWHVTIPLSKPALIAATFITVLPMLGDYYTNQLLSGAPGTTMIGNVIEGQLDSPGEIGQGAVLSLMLLVVLLIPMIYYVVSTARASMENA
jgi:spermidine/putrescine transport system permease protein